MKEAKRGCRDEGMEIETAKNRIYEFTVKLSQVDVCITLDGMDPVRLSEGDANRYDAVAFDPDGELTNADFTPEELIQFGNTLVAVGKHLASIFASRRE